MFKSTLTAAAMGVALIAAPAIAGPTGHGSTDAGAAQSMVIKYKDLNLSTAEGQARLERRIDAAARKVCGVGKSRTGTRIPSAAGKQCFAKARQSARNQMASVVNDTRRGG